MSVTSILTKGLCCTERGILYILQKKAEKHTCMDSTLTVPRVRQGHSTVEREKETDQTMGTVAVATKTKKEKKKRRSTSSRLIRSDLSHL